MTRIVARCCAPPIGAAVLAVLLLHASPATAQERIRAYDSEVEIRADGSIDVTEHITVRAEGSDIRRGIYRDFPTRYRDRHGNRVRVDLEVLGVERDGAPEAWFTERRGNGIRINTGGDDFLPTLPAEYTFTLRYRTTRQLGFFAAHDELYWNAIGTGWDFPIERGSVVVRLPADVPVEELGVEAYTGPQGARGSAYQAATPAPGTARYELTEALDMREGFTVVLTFPKGIVAEPTGAQRTRWFLRDNGGVLVALIGLLLLLVYTIRTWHRVGRDPARGVIIPRYEPPAGHTPAALRYLLRMGYDMRCFSSDILALAVAGHVRIHRDRKRFSEKWQLERIAPPASAAARAGVVSGEGGAGAAGAGGEDSAGEVLATGGARADRSGPARAAAHPLQTPLLATLFPAGLGRLELSSDNAATVSGARTAHSKALDAALHPRYFERNTGKTRMAFGLVALTAVVAFMASGGAGVPLIMVALVLMLIIAATFGSLVRAPTAEGRRLLDEAEGLKLYLSVAERDDLARMQGPDSPPRLDAARFEALLPYAVALEVEDAWTKKFTAAVGVAAVAAATQRMGWYSGTGRASDLGDFSRAIGSSLTSSISSASSPPGSSSGSGGGGSSGGGGGGGGGGGR